VLAWADILGLLVAAQVQPGCWSRCQPGLGRPHVARTLLNRRAGARTRRLGVAVVAAALGSPALLGVADLRRRLGHRGLHADVDLFAVAQLVSSGDLPRSNARLELARAIVSLAAPVTAACSPSTCRDVGLWVAHSGRPWRSLHPLPCEGARTQAGAERPSLLSAIQAGARSSSVTTCCAA